MNSLSHLCSVLRFSDLKNETFSTVIASQVANFDDLFVSTTTELFRHFLALKNKVRKSTKLQKWLYTALATKKILRSIKACV